MQPITQGQGFQSDAYSNIPNMSLAFTMYTTTFGNGSFVIQPPMANAIGDDFPSVPYLSLEAVLYEAQSSNPATAAVNVTGGTAISQSVISGNQIGADSTGTPRSLTGTQVQTTNG